MQGLILRKAESYMQFLSFFFFLFDARGGGRGAYAATVSPILSRRNVLPAALNAALASS
jgi:hypothetical protein